MPTFNDQNFWLIYFSSFINPVNNFSGMVIALSQIGSVVIYRNIDII